MDFQPSEMQQQIAQMIRDFGKVHIQPHVIDWDENQEFPPALLQQMGELGLMGVLVPEQYNGAGFGYPEYVTAISEVAKFCGAIGLSMAAHNSLCTGHILQFASEELKEFYVDFEHEFTTFFEDIQKQSKQKLLSL